MKKYLGLRKFWSSIVLGLVIVGIVIVSASHLISFSDVLFAYLFGADYSGAYFVPQTILIVAMLCTVSVLLMAIVPFVLRFSFSWGFFSRLVLISALPMIACTLVGLGDQWLGFLAPGNSGYSDVFVYSFLALIPLSLVLGVIYYAKVLTDSITNKNN